MNTLKRLISLTAAIALMISIINISVFAEENTTVMTNKEYYTAQSWLIDKYCDGEITFEQFLEQSQSVTNEYVNANTVGGVLSVSAHNACNTVSALAQKLGSVINSYGDEARGYVSDWWNGVCNKKGVPTETTQTSNTDMKGYGALFVITQTNVTDYKHFRYCDYIIIETVGDTTYYWLVTASRDGLYVWDCPSKGHHGSNGFRSYDNLTNRCTFDYSLHTYEFYGDVRYRDGTPYPTDDEYTYGSIYNYEGLTEKQLEDLIDAFSDKITLENPDLSSLEGLLNAIYSRLGTLDSDDDEAMLSAINAAIISLASDNNASNIEIIELLKELKDKKTEGSDTEPILKELKEINNSLDYLKTINTLDLIGDTIDTLLELTDSERTFLDTYATLILNLTAKLGYKPVTAMISNLEAIMFNGNPPQDIAVNIYDTQVVLLSASSFEKLQITETLNLAKMFVSVLLVVSWLYGMRKKITGGA